MKEKPGDIFVKRKESMKCSEKTNKISDGSNLLLSKLSILGKQ